MKKLRSAFLCAFIALIFVFFVPVHAVDWPKPILPDKTGAPAPVRSGSPSTSPSVAPNTAGTAPLTPIVPAGISGQNLRTVRNDDLTAVDDLPKDSALQAGRRVLALATGVGGQIWLGTEDDGIWRYATQAHGPKQWTHFTRNDGLSDDSAYAIACDKRGRIWVGHLKSGISVFNGEAWRNYDVPDGPAGERVFDIAVSPLDDSVWIATNGGLSCYSLENEAWTPLVGLEELRGVQISCLTFNLKGDLFAGSQCDGVFIAHAADNYQTWHNVRGPAKVTAAPLGKGLPGNFINDVLVTKDQTVCVATTAGLARSFDDGVNWNYLRGEEWQDKAPVVAGVPPLSARPQSSDLLLEDYITCLAEDEKGRLWLGHWLRGCEVREPHSDKRFLSRSQPDYVTAMLPFNGKVFMGFYGAGARSLVEGHSDAEFQLPRGVANDASALLPITIPAIPKIVTVPFVPFVPEGALKAPNVAVAPPPPAVIAKDKPAEPAPLPLFPTRLQAPQLAELNSMLRRLESVPALAATVTALPDDWRTQGDWLGRYGRYWACLCAMLSPDDYLWGAGARQVNYDLRIGPRFSGDSLRYWVHWLYTDNPRSLEMPPVYLQSRLARKLTTPDKFRRQAEADDHGENYPMTRQGPNIYATIKVPPGLFVLGLYNYNKDGDHDLNRHRDYALSVRPVPDKMRWPGDIKTWDTRPELAHGRMRDFRGGVWKRFLVRGPQSLTVEVNRNYSFNTILAAVTLDLVDEEPPPYFDSIANWQTRRGEREKASVARRAESAEQHASHFAPATSADEAAQRLFEELEALHDWNPAWQMTEGRAFYAALARWHLEAIKRAGLNATSQSEAPRDLGVPQTPFGNTSVSNTTLLTTDEKVLFSRLATCHYQLHCHQSWEEYQRLAGKTPARDIEKSVKWNGDLDCRGKGYAFIARTIAQSSPKP